jgi:hypothetical protein
MRLLKKIAPTDVGGDDFAHNRCRSIASQSRDQAGEFVGAMSPARQGP